MRMFFGNFAFWTLPIYWTNVTTKGRDLGNDHAYLHTTYIIRIAMSKKRSILLKAQFCIELKLHRGEVLDSHLWSILWGTIKVSEDEPSKDARKDGRKFMSDNMSLFCSTIRPRSLSRKWFHIALFPAI